MENQDQNVKKTQEVMATEKQALAQSFDEQAHSVSVQHQALQQHIERIRERQSNWIGRLMTSTEEKEMLETYWQKQADALDTVLEDRNRSLQVIGDAQTRFVREVCDSLLVSTRGQIQLSRSIRFQQRFLQLNLQLESLNDDFMVLLEDKAHKTENSAGPIRNLHQRQLDRAMERWDSTYARLLDEFAGIIQQR